MRQPDLTPQEQANVRLALRYLRMRCGSWAVTAKALGITEGTIINVNCGSTNVSAGMAFRVARFVEVPIGDLLGGKFRPAGTCPHCGQPVEPLADAQ